MTVLSLCDGMSCGQIALKELGIPVDNYFASEIDPIAMRVTMDNFPHTIQMQDLTLITEERLTALPHIDLILCGFPCRDLSRCTRQGGSKNWVKMHERGEGLDGEHSGLYHRFLAIYKWVLAHNNPNVKFLVENVASMKDAEKRTIDKDLNVNGIMLDSADFSAQTRKRYYWTNIPQSPVTDVCKDVIADILDDNVDEKYFYDLPIETCVSDTMYGRLVYKFKAHEIARRIYKPTVKCPTLTACRGGNLQKKVFVDGRCRKLTPHEYRRLQTIPDWYIMNVADSHIYNMCGDGWNIETIKHLLKGLKDEL